VQNRGGAVYANVVELFKSHPPRPWNAAEIQDALEKEGKAAPDTKAIHNTLTYLASAGHIERISRGRYVLRAWGVSIDTPSANDFDLPSAGGARITEHDV
jgi:hypothetical protein